MKKHNAVIDSELIEQTRADVCDFFRRTFPNLTDCTLDNFVSDTVPPSLENEARTGRIEYLINEASKGDEVAWVKIERLVKSFEEYQQPMPPIMAGFFLKVMRDELKRPRRRGRSPYPKFNRDQLIAQAVQFAREQIPSLHATRNEASENPSACSLVAECLAEVGIPIKEQAVVHIWQERKSEYPAEEEVNPGHAIAKINERIYLSTRPWRTLLHARIVNSGHARPPAGIATGRSLPDRTAR